LVCAGMFLLLVIVFVISSVVGAQKLSLSGALCALTGKASCSLSAEERAILFDIRLPRILLAGAVGTCLAAAGAAYQALLRNPLAEPYLLGVSNGAAVGTMVALVFFGAHEWSRPVMAFGGAIAATFLVYRLARGRAGASPERLILAGVIVTTFLSSAIVFITTVMDATRIRWADVGQIQLTVAIKVALGHRHAAGNRHRRARLWQGRLCSVRGR